MDIRYYKEQHHNYMVIRRTEDESVVGYQQKMLAGHRMEYLIPESGLWVAVNITITILRPN